MAPVWLNRQATLAKVASAMRLAAQEHCKLVVFGEALVPGYPFWLELTGGARFNDAGQKEMHARYLLEAVDIARGILLNSAHWQKSCNSRSIWGLWSDQPTAEVIASIVRWCT